MGELDRKQRTVMFCLGAGLVVACGTDGRTEGNTASVGPIPMAEEGTSADDETTDGSTPDPGTSGASNSASASASASTSESASETMEVRFDLGESPDAGPPPTSEGCQKVDLLFVIDNSGSMADEQASLTASFPNFIAGIQDTLAEAHSYHVATITTDAYAANAPGCQSLGAFITQTSGVDASNATCTPFANNLRFMTQDDDLADKFTCAAQPGSDGNGNERPLDAVRQALSPALGAPGACNEGFLRDDALLVIVFITDEEDNYVELFGLPLEGSADDPAQWMADIVARKGGIEQNVVVLSLVGTPKPNECPDFQWDGFEGAEIATRIITFTEMFTYGFVGDVCAANYGPFFDEAIAVIDTACETFEPPG